MSKVISELDEEEEEGGVADGLAEGDDEEGEPRVGAREAEGYGDDGADEGEGAEEADPDAVALEPPLGTLQLRGLHVEVLLYPFHLAERADGVVEHRAGGVAHGGGHEQTQGIQTGQQQGGQHDFAAEGEHAAGNEGGEEHSPVAPGFKDGKEGGQGNEEIKKIRNDGMME